MKSTRWLIELDNGDKHEMYFENPETHQHAKELFQEVNPDAVIVHAHDFEEESA